jgi:hypothetical protein
MIVNKVLCCIVVHEVDMLGWWRRVAVALPGVKRLWKALRMLARSTELDPAKVCAMEANLLPDSAFSFAITLNVPEA